MQELKTYIKNSTKQTKIIISGDSQRISKNGRQQVVYVALVIVHNHTIAGIGKGAKLFKHITVEDGWPPSLRDRLLREVEHIINIASDAAEVIGDRHLEIHLDINNKPEHKSNAVMKEVCGWVFGMLGIWPLIKPHAWASANGADHFAKGKHMKSAC